jgi:hypothetical protein
LKYPEDVEIFAKYRDRQKFMHFMMALRADFESTRASLLHRNPLPTLEAAVTELMSEETRRSTMHLQSPDMVVAATSQSVPKFTPGQSTPQSSFKKLMCNYCKQPGHSIANCYKLQNRRQSQAPFQQTAAVVSSGSSAPASYTENPSQTSALTASDVEALIHQVLSRSSTALSVTSGKNLWFIDSACCNHMTSDPTLFSQKSALSPNPTIYTADGSRLPVSHTGSISSPNLSVDNTYLVPQLSLNLLSVGQLCELGLELTFSSRGVDVQDPQTGQLIGTGRKIGRLFQLSFLQTPTHLTAAVTTSNASSSLWHSHLGHASFPRVQLLASQGHLGSVDLKSFDCISCHLGKQTHFSFNKSESLSSAPFDLVHSDIWGPAPVPTEGGSRYFVIFLDDYSRYTWIYLLQHRSELTQIYQNFHQMVQTQFSRTIKIFRSDNAMEYNEKSFQIFLKQNGTLSHRSCPYTSQQNGHAERKHRHILDIVRALLISASLPERFWVRPLSLLFTLLIVSLP